MSLQRQKPGSDWCVEHAELFVGRAVELAANERESYSRVRVVRRTLSALGVSTDIYAVVVDLSSLKG